MLQRKQARDPLTTIGFVLVVLGVVSPSEAGAKTEIGELEVTPSSDQDVVGLDVSMDEAEGVDALNGHGELGNVEPGGDNNQMSTRLNTKSVVSQLPGLILGESALLDQQGHQITTGDVLHHEVEIVFVLKEGKNRR